MKENQFSEAMDLPATIQEVSSNNKMTTPKFCHDMTTLKET